MPIPPPNDTANEVARAAVQAQMQLLQGRYLEKLAATSAEIEAMLHFCEFRPLTPHECAELKSISHKLAGTGATYGFAGISTTARAVDDRLKAAPDTFDSVLVTLTIALASACRSALAPSASRTEPAPSPAPAPTRSAPAFGRRPAAPQPVHSARLEPRSRILIVDDDEAVRVLLNDLFCAEADIAMAVSAQAALRRIEDFQPSLVLLDDIMPDSISGLSLLEQLRADPRHDAMQVIMITASDAQEDIDRGMQAGAARYITKPFVPELVYFTVHGVMGKANLH